MRNIETKVDNTAPAGTGRLPADQFNSIQGELEGAVTSSGITLDGPSSDTDLFMLAQTMARYASGGVVYQDTGSLNAFVLSTPKIFKMPKAYFTGMMVMWYAGAGNTGPATVNANTIGAKPLYTHTGAALSGGETISNRFTAAVYDETLNFGDGGFKLTPWGNALLWGAGPGAGSTLYGYLLPCRVVAVTNLTLSGEQTIDGVACVAGNRVLVNGQTTGQNNGPYIVSAGAWSRATDFDSNTEAISGATVFISEGTAYADSQWNLQTNDTITLGTTALKWVEGQKTFGFSSSLSSASISANNFTLVSPSSATGNLGTSTYSNGVFTCGATEAGWWVFSLTVGFSPTIIVNDWDVMVGRVVGPSGDFAQHNVQGAGNQGNTANVCCPQKLAAGDQVSFYGYHLNTSGNFGAQISGARLGRA